MEQRAGGSLELSQEIHVALLQNLNLNLESNRSEMEMAPFPLVSSAVPTVPPPSPPLPGLSLPHSPGQGWAPSVGFLDTQ